MNMSNVRVKFNSTSAFLVNYLNAVKKDIGFLINFGPSEVELKRKYRQYKKK